MTLQFAHLLRDLVRDYVQLVTNLLDEPAVFIKHFRRFFSKGSQRACELCNKYGHFSKSRNRI